MSRKSERITLVESTSSAADSPAKTSVRQENEEASQAADRDCGQSTRASFAKCDRDSLSWRTSQRCVFGGWAPFSETWPRAGMMLSGTAYLLQPSAPLTDATGYSSSRGPNSIGLWPTPTADKDRTTNYNQGGMSLGYAARQWPTPTVKGNYNKASYAGKSGDGLATAVQKWPTPTARDHKDSGNQEKLAKHAHKKRLGCSVAASNPQGHGSLNPNWVEWLMGFPIGWTDSER